MGLRRRREILLPLLALLAGFSLLAALALGSLPLSPWELLQSLSGGGDGTARAVVVELRLPRALAAFASGALLALAGALMQVLLGNPLADPYVLGLSGGAAVAALLALLLGAPDGALVAAAFVGALLSMLLVFGLSGRGGDRTPLRLLLTGVLLASGWGAVIGLLLALAPDANLRGMLFWLMGDLSQARDSLPAYLALVAGLAATLPVARDLDLLARGGLQASLLGVEVERLRTRLYIVASLLTAVAVTLGGTIGFVGLVVPHLLRLAGGGAHRRLLPASVLLGGTLVVVADTLARTVAAPHQLPVGTFTALLGVPLFLYLLLRGRR